MNASHFFYALRWMVRDTFRQATYTGLFGVMLGISAVFIFVCLSIGVSGDVSLDSEDGVREFLPRFDPDNDPRRLQNQGVRAISGELTLLFGAFHLPLARDRRDAVIMVQLLLAGVIADGAGILLALLWTAGFVPAFIEPSAASVLLTKPISRSALLVAKFLSVLVFVLFQASIFVVGTWLALGLRTSIWDAGYLWAVPLLVLHFGCFYAFSVLLAVSTRSTVASAIGSVAFWLMCWGMNFGRHLLMSVSEAEQITSPGLRALSDLAYWVLPKPADLSMFLFQALDGQRYFIEHLKFSELVERGILLPELSVLSSLGSMLFMLFCAVRGLADTDY